MKNELTSVEKKLLTREIRMKKVNLRNKMVLGTFLFIAISTLIMRLVISVLLDLGMGQNGSINLKFWQVQDFDAQTKPMQEAISMRPNFFWILTQFTWITTIIIIVFLIFRFFKYDQNTLPRWIKWIMTQRTLSLITMYDVIVGMFFWASMFKGFSEGFAPFLYEAQVTNTVLVHAVIPLLMVIYSFIYLARDKKASILKGLFIVKGMFYPFIYVIYYVLIAAIWKDPYPITHLHEDFIHGKFTGLWMGGAILFGLYAFLGFMITIHNSILLRFNKKYDPKRDYEIWQRKKNKIEKVKARARVRFAKQKANEEHISW